MLALAAPSQPSLVEEAAVATTAAIEWKITVEGTDVLGEVRRHEIRIDKAWDRSVWGLVCQERFSAFRCLSWLEGAEALVKDCSGQVEWRWITAGRSALSYIAP